MALTDRPILTRGVIAVALLAALALSACGRKGDLEPPPGAATTDGGDAAKKGDEKPQGRFFLDPLL